MKFVFSITAVYLGFHIFLLFLKSYLLFGQEFFIFTFLREGKDALMLLPLFLVLVHGHTARTQGHHHQKASDH